jgi:hypothetical protein
MDAIRTRSVRELEGIGEVPDTRPIDAPSRNFPDPDPSYETGQTPPLGADAASRPVASRRA